MEKNLFFDVCAIIIMLILFISVFLHKMTKGRTNRMFIYATICCMLAAVFDIGCEAFGVWLPIRESYTLLRYLLFYGYFIFRNLTALMYLLFLICVTDTWHLIAENKITTILICAPYAVVLAVLAANPWTKAIFYIDDTLAYRRGENIMILYVCSGIYLFIALAHLLQYRRLFSKDKLIGLLSLFPLTIGAVLFQLFKPHMLVEVFATVIALLFVIITVQRPEENVHPVLGIANLQAHNFELQRSFHNKKKFDMILIRVRNHSSILTILGYDVLYQLLGRIVKNIQDICKKNDTSGTLYYLENGNFALVLSEAKNIKKTDSIANEINLMLRTNTQVDKYTLALQAHVCVIHCPKDIQNYQTLSTFETTFHTMASPSAEVIPASTIISQSNFHLHAELGIILSRALANRSFDVFYQPIYSIQERRFVSAEALVRLRDKKYGYVSPALFIPAAEKNGAIYQIGEFVFEEVCKFIKSPDFPELGLDCIEINLSVAQCMQPDLAKHLIQIAKKYEVNPRLINLEITETAVENSREVMMNNLKELEAAGFRLSLDDYGIGYSNIQRIATLPLDIVKLDKTFVDKVQQDNMQIILSNTIRMLKDLNLQIVVEGVETAEQLDYITELNCDYIQGFYFSRPLPKKEFASFIEQQRP